MKREKKAKQDHGTVFSTLCMVLFGAALGIFAGKDLFEIVEVFPSGSTCCMSPGSS